MKKLLLLALVALMASCKQENSMETLAKQHVEQATGTWLDNRAKGSNYTFTISNVKTVIANDSLCVLSYNVAATSDGNEDAALLNYLIAKHHSGYKELILHEKYDVMTPETFKQGVEAYKEEMKNDYTPEEIESEIPNNIYKTIVSDGIDANW